MRTFASLLALALVGLFAHVGCGSTGSTSSSSSNPDGGPDYRIVDAGGDPATPPDGKAACPAGVCNYQTGAGCTDMAIACVPSVDAMGKATPSCTAPGTKKIDEACKAANDCGAGMFCVGGACRELCCGGDWTGCSSPNEHCIAAVAFSDGKGGVIQTGAMACLPVNTCDALNPASCNAPGTTCQIVDPTGATACLPDGTGGPGEACPCKGGYLCVAGACRRLCKAVEGGGDPACQSGEGDCVHFTRDPMNVGECTN
jgi:hypothetical protein